MFEMKKVNKYGSLVLITVMIFTMIANPISYLKFKLNQEYIAKVMCVNKARPELKCNGHCYYMKKFAKAQKEEASAKKMLENVAGFVLYFSENNTFTFINHSNEIQHISVLKQLSLQNYFSNTIQPPRI